MYFDPVADLELLPTSVREHVDLDLVAAQAEADVVARFTVAGDGGPAVVLTGYDPDSDLAEPGLRDALTGAVARVTAHRLRSQASQGVRYERRGERTVGYYETPDALWPAGWDQALRAFVPRPAVLYRI